MAQFAHPFSSPTVIRVKIRALIPRIKEYTNILEDMKFSFFLIENREYFQCEVNPRKHKYSPELLIAFKLLKSIILLYKEKRKIFE